MRILSRRAHGWLDYAVGLLLIFAPRWFGFDHGGAEQRVPEVLGVVAILTSLLTNYELGLIKLIPFRVHLTFDVLHGGFLALSPWLFQFSEIIWLPHVLLGVAELGVVTITRAAGHERRVGALPRR